MPDFEKLWKASLMANDVLRAHWNADSQANLEATVLLRAICAEALEWARTAIPDEVRENLNAAIRSDWAFLRNRFTPEYIDSLLDVKAG